MGIADTYGNTQLKVGNPTVAHFKIGMKVSIPDGVYVGYEGVVVIVNGRFTAEFDKIHTKWNDEINLQPILEEFNPIALGVKAMVAEKEKTDRRKRRALINIGWVLILVLVVWLALAWSYG